MSALTKEKLEELQKKQLPRASAEGISLGLKVSQDTPEARAMFEEAKRRIAEYLEKFLVPDGSCIGCGEKLVGHDMVSSLFSTFEWGLCHGEGFCRKCGYPARAIHRIKLDDEGGELTFNRVLQYAPDGLSIRQQGEVT